MFYLLFLYGYNMLIIQLINKCREVQNTVFLQDEANVAILLRGNLRGQTRKALHHRQFTNIKQFMDRLKTSLEIMGNIF